MRIIFLKKKNETINLELRPIAINIVDDNISDITKVEAKNLKQQFDNEIENKIKIKDKFFNCRGCRSVEEAEIKAMVYCMNNLRQYFYNKKMIDISYFNNKDLTGIRNEVFEIIVDFIKNVIVYTRPIRECINAFCNIKREIGKLQDYIVDKIWGMPCDKASQISEIRRCVNRLVEGYEIKEKIQQYRNNKKDFFDSLKNVKINLIHGKILLLRQ